MKHLPTLVCAALVALVLPACSSAPKKQETASCCAAKSGAMKGSCDAKMKKHKH